MNFHKNNFTNRCNRNSVTISVLAVLGLSPGPIYNCIRGLVQAGKTPDKFTLLIPERNEGPLPETVVTALEKIFPVTEFKCVQLPSLGVPFKEMAQKIQSLDLNPTHFLILTGTTQLICSIQCILPPDVIALHLSSSPPHSKVNLLSVSHNQILSTLNTPSKINEVLEINGMIKTQDRRQVKHLVGPNRSVNMDLEEYQITNEGLSGGNKKVKCTSLSLDARCVFHVTFGWAKNPDNRAIWWKFVHGEAGKFRKQLGARAVSFSSSGVDASSQKDRLSDFDWS